MNKKTLVNTVLKTRSQKTSRKPLPPRVPLRMLRFVATEVMFRITMMFLKINAQELRDNIQANVQEFSDEIVTSHQSKILFLLEHMYPSIENDLAGEFKQLEQQVGHNLFVKAIMAISKTGVNKITFAKGIPPLQWNKFVCEEQAVNHPAPMRESVFLPPAYKDQKKGSRKRISQLSKSLSDSEPHSDDKPLSSMRKIKQLSPQKKPAKRPSTSPVKHAVLKMDADYHKPAAKSKRSSTTDSKRKPPLSLDMYSDDENLREETKRSPSKRKPPPSVETDLDDRKPRAKTKRSSSTPSKRKPPPSLETDSASIMTPKTLQATPSYYQKQSNKMKTPPTSPSMRLHSTKYKKRKVPPSFDENDPEIIRGLEVKAMRKFVQSEAKVKKAKKPKGIFEPPIPMGYYQLVKNRNVRVNEILQSMQLNELMQQNPWLAGYFKDAMDRPLESDGIEIRLNWAKSIVDVFSWASEPSLGTSSTNAVPLAASAPPQEEDESEESEDEDDE